jgi:hypothetical protein
LDDRYRLDERIAAGGVGQVWRATDLLLERTVAVKVLRPEYSDHPETLDRFRKEARHAGAISNAHVAQLYDYGPCGPGGSPYLVMEYVDGPSLADILVVDPIDPVRALDIIAQAADGLSAAHRLGLVHRDVKPGNILLGGDGQVKVTDFGIAHAAGQVPVTGPGLVMGTTQYMAPERIAGSQGTAASDVYALGIVLHECLTGVPPHDGTPAEVMAAHLYLPLPPLPAGTPPELAELVARLTVKDPAQRISDARELSDLAATLRDFLGGTVQVPPASSGPQRASGAAPANPVPRAGALAPEAVSALAGGTSLASPVHAAAYGSAAGPAAHGLGAGTAQLPSPGVPGGPVGHVSDEWDEWDVPARMSLPARPSQAGQPGPARRRKTGTIAAGAAAVASVGLVALLVSGALSGSPAANRAPAGSTATGGPTLGRVPSSSSSGPAAGSRPASGVADPGATAATGTPGSQATKAAAKPSASPAARASGSSGSPAPSGAPSAAPSGGTSGAPSAAPPSSPSGTPASTPGSGAPTPSPTKSACLLGLCF